MRTTDNTKTGALVPASRRTFLKQAPAAAALAAAGATMALPALAAEGDASVAQLEEDGHSFAAEFAEAILPDVEALAGGRRHDQGNRGRSGAVAGS